MSEPYYEIAAALDRLVDQAYHTAGDDRGREDVLRDGLTVRDALATAAQGRSTPSNRRRLAYVIHQGVCAPHSKGRTALCERAADAAVSEWPAGATLARIESLAAEWASRMDVPEPGRLDITAATFRACSKALRAVLGDGR